MSSNVNQARYREVTGEADLWVFQCHNPVCGHMWKETDLSGIWLKCPRCDDPESLRVTRVTKRKPSLWMRTFALVAVLSACAAVAIAACAFTRAVMGA